MSVSCLVFLLVQSVIAADLRITTVRTTTETEFSPTGQARVLSLDKQTETEYSKGPLKRRERHEFWGEQTPYPTGPAPLIATVVNCEREGHLSGSFTLNLDAREYRDGVAPLYSAQLPESPSVTNNQDTGEKRKKTSGSPLASPNWITSIRDTKETKQVLGHTAYHIVTITTAQGSKNTANTRYPREEIFDGWYIDLKPQFDCHSYRSDAPDSSADRQRFFAGRFAVQEKTTIRSWPARDGTQHETVTETEVVDLSEQPLDPALFQIPPAFKKVERLFHR